MEKAKIDTTELEKIQDVISGLILDYVTANWDLDEDGEKWLIEVGIIHGILVAETYMQDPEAIMRLMTAPHKLAQWAMIAQSGFDMGYAVGWMEAQKGSKKVITKLKGLVSDYIRVRTELEKSVMSNKTLRGLRSEGDDVSVH